MKILIDMNLSPLWVDVLKQAGLEAVHWSDFGDPKASDEHIFEWARVNKHVVFTHDLDFGAILAATRARFPSVIQVRTQNVDPDFLKKRLLPTVKKFRKDLEEGALITIDETKARIRILPLEE